MDGVSSYRQKEIYQDAASSFRALYERGDELLRVEIQSHVESSEVPRRIDGQLAQVKTVFERARSPYAGQLSLAIDCDSTFLPVYDTVETESIRASRITAFLTDRLTYGACTKDQATHRSMLLLFYCPVQKKYYQLEFIASVSAFVNREADYEAMLQSIRCR